MEWLITNGIAALLIPPGSLLLLAAVGAVAALRRHRIGRLLVVLSFVALYLLSARFVADALLKTLEPEPQDPRSDRSGLAIVVLGGGTYFSAPEYGRQDTVSAYTLARLRYAAYLHHELGKPIMTTGGAPQGNAVPEAEQMRQVLRQDFRVPVQWAEQGSNNTLENARLSYRLLDAAGIQRIYLVTHAWHMPRAKLAFERAGFTVIPAPTGYSTRYELTVLDFLPSANALLRSSHFFHEAAGLGWYHLRFLFG